ncbi:YrzI family small protein [Metabacillus herbersteinensis]|uniref:YrzI family small protein n=1 Tax=Metabacillus herbersteinensis TaxID=283816 RepID=A0ABV6GAZ2_9BACI
MTINLIFVTLTIKKVKRSLQDYEKEQHIKKMMDEARIKQHEIFRDL